MKMILNKNNNLFLSTFLSTFRIYSSVHPAMHHPLIHPAIQLLNISILFMRLASALLEPVMKDIEMGHFSSALLEPVMKDI